MYYLPVLRMDKFDINKELEEISISENIRSLVRRYDFKINSYHSSIEYFYHGHRLGTRVPLIIIISDNSFLPVKSLRYFSKIANVLSFKIISIDNLTEVLSTFLRRYGTNTGIVLHFSHSNCSIYEMISTSSFIVSEIACFVCVSDKEVEVTECRKNATPLLLFFKTRTDEDLQNALILESLQNKLQLKSLDWKWQFDQSDKLFLFKNLVLKNYEKWKSTENQGLEIEGTNIIPMKIMKDDDAYHCPCQIMKNIPDLGLVIDLSNDEGSYDTRKFTSKGIQHKRIQIESKTVPSSFDIFEFINVLKRFISDNPSRKIIVHCHYGYNRTGLMICAFLIEAFNISVHEALNRFMQARPPGIKHQNYIDKLLIRYSDREEIEGKHNYLKE